MEVSIQFIDIIVIGLVAVFILLRLTNSFGRTDGHVPKQRKVDESGVFDGVNPNDSPIIGASADTLSTYGEKNNDVEAALETDEKVTEVARNILEKVSYEDQEFTLSDFIGGAKWAHTEITSAFAAGKLEILLPLLSQELYKNFAASIAERDANGESLERSLVDLVGFEIIDASFMGRTVEITVKFVSTQIDTYYGRNNVKLDIEENGVEREVVDIWTFSREIDSSGPVWLLVETEVDSL